MKKTYKHIDIKSIVNEIDYLTIYKNDIEYILKTELYNPNGLWGFEWLREFIDNDIYILIDAYGQYATTSNMPHLYVLNQYSSENYKKDELICITIEKYPHFLTYPKLNIDICDLQLVLNYIHRFYNELTLLANKEISFETYNELTISINESLNYDNYKPLNEMSIILHTETGLRVDIYVDNTGSGEGSHHKGSPRLKFGKGSDPDHGDYRAMLLYPPYDTPDGIPKGISSKDVKQLRGFVKANQDGLLKLYYSSKLKADNDISKFKLYMIKVNAHGEPLSNDTATGLLPFIYKDDVFDNIAKVNFRGTKYINFAYKDLNEIIYKDIDGNPYKFVTIGKFKKEYNGIYTTFAIDNNGDTYKLYSDGEIKKQ